MSPSDDFALRMLFHWAELRRLKWARAAMEAKKALDKASS